MKTETQVLIYKIPAVLILLCFFMLLGALGTDLLIATGIAGLVFMALIGFSVTKALLKPRQGPLFLIDHILFGFNIAVLIASASFLAGDLYAAG